MPLLKNLDDPNFADVRSASEITGYGSLGGEAVAAHHRVVAKMAPDGSGMTFQCFCQDCGLPIQLTVSWDELIYGAVNQVPVDPHTKRPWVYQPQHGGFTPDIGCRRCKRALMVLLYPDECVRHIRSGQAAGKIQPGYAERMMQMLRSRGGGYQR